MSRCRISGLTAILVCGSILSGCGPTKPTWTAEARSPDGKMVATAKFVQESGPGTAFASTTVWLNWINGSQQPTEILGFSDGPNFPDWMKVSLHWLASNKLEITYRGDRPIDFQAVKFAGVTISVRDLEKQKVP